MSTMTTTNNPLDIEQTPDECSGVVSDTPLASSQGAGGCPVVSVNQKTGAVVLNTDDIAEGNNKYLTDQRVRAALSGEAPIDFDQATGKISHRDSNITAGTYGSETQYPKITVDAKGHITSVQLQDVSTGGELSDNLAALDALTGLGYLVKTGTNTWAFRSISGTSGRVKLTNPAGTAGDAKIDLETIGTAGSYGSSTKIPKLTIDAYGRVTGVELVAVSATTPDSQVPSLGQLSNVDDSADSPQLGMTLVFDGTNWAPQASAETPITPKSTPTVLLQASGLNNHTLQADVNILEVLTRIRDTPAFKSLFCEIANSCIPPTSSWIADSTVCERSNKFNVSKSIVNMYSPMTVMYDSVLAKAFVSDSDNADSKGNIAWFDPLTATTPADLTYSDKVKQANIYCHVPDPEKRRIYLAGKDTGGLLVYDIPTDSISVVPYGTDGVAFNRVNVVRIGNNIYCSDATTSSLVIINRTTLVVTRIVNLSTVPSPERFAIGGFQITGNDTEVYVCAGSGSSVSTIGVYSPDFTTLIADITLPGTVQWVNGKFWQSAFYDATSKNVYVGDNGSSKTFVIDTTTHTVVSQQVFMNRQGKTNTTFVWSVNPVTNELMKVVTVLNTTTDPTFKKTLYIEDRATYESVQLFKDLGVGALVRVDNSSMMLGADSGLTGWSGGTTKDGKISFIDSAAVGGNTTRLLTLTLKEMLNGTPTGNTKANNTGDPDYIAPATNATACPLIVDLSCITDVTTTAYTDGTTQLFYEFNLPQSVLANGAVASVRISAFDTTATSVTGTPITLSKPASNYMTGSITNITSSTYVLQVEYLDAGGVVLKTCTQ